MTNPKTTEQTATTHYPAETFQVRTTRRPGEEHHVTRWPVPGGWMVCLRDRHGTILSQGMVEDNGHKWDPTEAFPNDHTKPRRPNPGPKETKVISPSNTKHPRPSGTDTVKDHTRG